jgi:hypothetical protein
MKFRTPVVIVFLAFVALVAELIVQFVVSLGAGDQNQQTQDAVGALAGSVHRSVESLVAPAALSSAL